MNVAVLCLAGLLTFLWMAGARIPPAALLGLWAVGLVFNLLVVVLAVLAVWFFWSRRPRGSND